MSVDAAALLHELDVRTAEGSTRQDWLLRAPDGTSFEVRPVAAVEHLSAHIFRSRTGAAASTGQRAPLVGETSAHRAPSGTCHTSDRPLSVILYKLYDEAMTSVTMSQFRSRQSELMASAQAEPVTITSRGVGRRAVVVSPEFFDRALEALEDKIDVEAAAEARREGGTISHRELMDELGL